MPTPDDTAMPPKTQSKPTKTTPRKPGDRAAFAKTRARLDKRRAKRRQKMLWVHYWLLCPKCGGDMFVQETMKIRYEVCRSCHGIAIDGEEAKLLLDHLDPGKALRAILKKSKKPDTTEI
jgi:Zn-finger nucleic acid-binding protein